MTPVIVHGEREAATTRTCVWGMRRNELDLKYVQGEEKHLLEEGVLIDDATGCSDVQDGGVSDFEDGQEGAFFKNGSARVLWLVFGGHLYEGVYEIERGDCVQVPTVEASIYGEVVFRDCAHEEVESFVTSVDAISEGAI